MEFTKFNEDIVSNSHDEFLELQKSFGVYKFNDLTIEAWKGVYHPVDESSTLFMIRNLPNIKDKQILELGCGAGLVGLCFCKDNQVVLSDINEEAVLCAQHNAQINNLNAEIKYSDLFDSFENRQFDYILFNTPYWHRPPLDEVDLVACDENGKLFKKFIKQSSTYLKENGKIIFTYSNLSSEFTLMEAVKENNLTIQVIGEETHAHTGIVRWLIQGIFSK